MIWIHFEILQMLNPANKLFAEGVNESGWCGPILSNRKFQEGGGVAGGPEGLAGSARGPGAGGRGQKVLWPPAQSSREKSQGEGQWSGVAVWEGPLPLAALSLRLSVVTAGVPCPAQGKP